MTNALRRQLIAQINELLTPLTHEKFIASLRLNYLSNQNGGSLSKQNEDEFGKIKIQLNELNDKIIPLLNQLKELQVEYYVEYDGQILEGGLAKVISNKRRFFLSTLAEIDSTKGNVNLNDPDIINVINEIKDFIYATEYSQFTINHIKRIDN